MVTSCRYNFSRKFHTTITCKQAKEEEEEEKVEREEQGSKEPYIEQIGDEIMGGKSEKNSEAVFVEFRTNEFLQVSEMCLEPVADEDRGKGADSDDGEADGLWWGSRMGIGGSRTASGRMTCVEIREIAQLGKAPQQLRLIRLLIARQLA